MTQLRAPQFDDPAAKEPDLLRCFYCKEIHIMHTETTYDGGCIKCGSRRMRNVGLIGDDEMADLIRRGFDPTVNWTYERNEDYEHRVRTKRSIDEKHQLKKAVTRDREGAVVMAERRAEKIHRLSNG